MVKLESIFRYAVEDENEVEDDPEDKLNPKCEDPKSEIENPKWGGAKIQHLNS